MSFSYFEKSNLTGNQLYAYQPGFRTQCVRYHGQFHSNSSGGSLLCDFCNQHKSASTLVTKKQAADCNPPPVFSITFDCRKGESFAVTFLFKFFNRDQTGVVFIPDLFEFFQWNETNCLIEQPCFGVAFIWIRWPQGFHLQILDILTF